MIRRPASLPGLRSRTNWQSFPQLRLASWVVYKTPQHAELKGQIGAPAKRSTEHTAEENG
jgi:hypothetical protein